MGSGKTALVRHLFDELHENEAFKPYLNKISKKLPIFTSTINAETELSFLGAWRPIFQMMIQFYCKKNGLKREHFIAEKII